MDSETGISSLDILVRCQKYTYYFARRGLTYKFVTRSRVRNQAAKDYKRPHFQHFQHARIPRFKSPQRWS